jgi:ubiquinone/menaquinone biosynthesis C-methylase UbiE
MSKLPRPIGSVVILLVVCLLPGSIASGQNEALQSDLSLCGFGLFETLDQPTRLQDEESTQKLPDAQGGDDQASDERSEPESKSKIPEGLEIYMGRRIARTMHYAGAEWLIRDVREREERCSLMLANLGVKPGMTICDMGCGNGFHSLPMAKMTGENGMVIGVDVQPEMLGLLRDRMEDQGVENIIPILGSYHNPRLPSGSIDLVLMVDVYHEFSHPEQMLAAIRKSLKADGLVVLVEYREEDESVPIKPLHKMSKAQVNKELEANGFKLAKEFDKLPWQHMMFFGKSDDTERPDRAEPDSTGQDKQPAAIDKAPQ